MSGYLKMAESGSFLTEEEKAQKAQKAQAEAPSKRAVAQQDTASIFETAMATLRGTGEAIGGTMNAARENLTPSPETVMGAMKAHDIMGETQVPGIAQAYEGPTQMLLGQLADMGIVDPQMVEDYTNESFENRELVKNSIKERYGDDAWTEFATALGTGVGRAIPETIATAPAIGYQGVKLVDSGKRIAAATGFAGAGGAMELLKEGQSRTYNAIVSGLFGAVTGGLFETIPALFNGIGKLLHGGSAWNDPSAPGKIAAQWGGETDSWGKAKTLPAPNTRAAQTAQRRKNIEGSIELMDETGINLTPAQVNPDARVEDTMRLAQNNRKIEEDVRFIHEMNAEKVGAYSHGIVERLKEKAGTGARFGARVKSTFHQVLGVTDNGAGGVRQTGKGLMGARDTQALVDFKAADDAVNGLGVIRLDGFKARLDDLVAKGSSRTGNAVDERIAKQAEKLREKLFGEANADEFFSPMQVQELLKTYGRAAKGTGRLFTDIDPSDDVVRASRLFGSLKDDLAKAIDEGGPGAALLDVARNNYRDNSEKIRELEKGFVGRLLKTDLKDSSIEQAFLKADPEEMRASLDVLATANPQLKKSLQAFWLEDAMIEATRAGPAAAGELIERTVPGKLLELLLDRKRSLRLDVVFSGSEERKNVETLVRAAAAVILNNNRTGGKTATRLKDLAGVLASMNSTFQARLAAEALSPLFLSKFANGGPEVAKAMLTFSKPFTQQQGLFAISVLANHMQKEWPESVESEDGN